MYTKAVKVTAPDGLHMQTSVRFLRRAVDFRSNINVIANGIHADGKSLISILALSVDCGMAIEIAASGPDEKAAVESLVKVVSSDVDE